MADDPAGVWAAGLGTAGFFAVLIVIIWQIAATWRARMLASREQQYKQLAEKYAQLLEDNVELHRKSIEELTQARRSIASMEKMMREIE
ncbi:YwqI/YxiC family protein [Streptomyces sp. SB3404]|uniref:YwqI/YxiC family protein n=1 Tax=Streptomyces boncukensis TaxID=2711219 RepID=A0A6G4X192_9ACTN|nr:YwqI/YxiC family protein [Streptomyces boncukensis]